jgi:hypothetical protein
MMVDLWFPLVGRTLPSDHGYGLYGALCRMVPELHEATDWGLHTLRGQPLGPGVIGLSRNPQLGAYPTRAPHLWPQVGRLRSCRHRRGAHGHAVGGLFGLVGADRHHQVFHGSRTICGGRPPTTGRD